MIKAIYQGNFFRSKFLLYFFFAISVLPVVFTKVNFDNYLLLILLFGAMVIMVLEAPRIYSNYQDLSFNLVGFLVTLFGGLYIGIDPIFLLIIMSLFITYTIADKLNMLPEGKHSPKESTFFSLVNLRFVLLLSSVATFLSVVMSYFYLIILNERTLSDNLIIFFFFALLFSIVGIGLIGYHGFIKSDL